MAKKSKKLTKSKKLATVLVIIVCCGAVYGFKVFTGSSKRSLATMAAHAKVKGNANAPLKITEFIDFQCPACAKGAKYLKEKMEEHPDLIRLELKHYPLAMHRHGVLSAQYAECAAEQGKFWPLHDLLLARQNNWKRLDDVQPALAQMVMDAEIDVDQLNACFTSGTMNKVIRKNKLEGDSLGIRSTPTYFVNGKMVVGKKSLEMEINKYLEENGN